MAGRASRSPLPRRHPPPSPDRRWRRPTANLTDGCVTNYDAKIDYFPDKITLTHTTGFAIEYHNNYKVVTVKTPWQGAKEPLQYVLVQCGTPTPADFKQAEIVEVPVKLLCQHVHHLSALPR